MGAALGTRAIGFTLRGSGAAAVGSSLHELGDIARSAGAQLHDVALLDDAGAEVSRLLLTFSGPATALDAVAAQVATRSATAAPAAWPGQVALIRGRITGAAAVLPRAHDGLPTGAEVATARRLAVGSNELLAQLDETLRAANSPDWTPKITDALASTSDGIASLNHGASGIDAAIAAFERSSRLLLHG